MLLLSGKNWSGSLHFNDSDMAKASGRVNGYSWYFQSKSNSWVVEIAEDPAIETHDLPLVGYGCGGWLYESDKCILPDNEADFIQYINTNLSLVFAMLHQNKLKYLPAVTCACSD